LNEAVAESELFARGQILRPTTREGIIVVALLIFSQTEGLNLKANDASMTLGRLMGQHSDIKVVVNHDFASSIYVFIGTHGDTCLVVRLFFFVLRISHDYGGR
jgi:hypothetical protein